MRQPQPQPQPEPEPQPELELEEDDEPEPDQKQLVHAFMDTYKRTAGQKKQIVRAFGTLPYNDIRVTGISKVAHERIADVLDMQSDEDAINELLQKRNLGPLTDFQRTNSVAYGKYDKSGKLVSVMVTTTVMLGNPFKIGVLVDWIATIVSSNHPSSMVEKLKAKVNRRKQKSYVITQCDNKKAATKFWQGRLTRSMWADVLVGLMYIYDADMQIYENATNMIS